MTRDEFILEVRGYLRALELCELGTLEYAEVADALAELTASYCFDAAFAVCEPEAVPQEHVA